MFMIYCEVKSTNSELVIKETKVIAVIKRMQSRDKDDTWKTDMHNKEHRVTKIMHTQ